MAIEVKPAWHSVKTKKWKISGGPAVSAAFGIKGTCKSFTFTNEENNKSGVFFFSSIGGALAAQVELPKLGATKQDEKFLGGFFGTMDRAANFFGNPFTLVDLKAKLTVHRPFSFDEIMFSVGGVFSAGASALASVEAKVFAVGDTSGGLFQIEAPAAELKLAVGVEVLSLSAGIFLPSGEFDYIQKEKFNRMLKTPPSQNWIFDPGKM